MPIVLNSAEISMDMQRNNNSKSVETVAQLKQELNEMRKENEALRAENQKLRTELVKKSKSKNAETNDRTLQGASSEAIEGGYWISTSSKKRHNSKCRYFKTSKGRIGTKEEGIPCKICGG
jgi:regulator of replication initiation timing